MIRAEHIVKSFDGRVVLDDISVEFETGKTNLIIGRSGSGKTVLLKTLVGLHEPDSGDVWYDEVNFSKLGFRERKSIRKDIGMIFQGGALLDSSTVVENVKLPLDLFTSQSEKEKMERVDFCLQRVRLEDANHLYPAELSGGMIKRVAIARAIVLEPDLIIADEPISALDVSIQAQVINLLEKLQREKGFSYLFIAHDLEMVHHISHKIGVMYLGNMVELGSSDDVYKKPLHPYTRALISAAPIADPKMAKEKKRIILEGEVPSPINPPKGCPFAGRCKYATEECKSKKPDTYMYDNRQVACNLYSPKNLAQYKAVGKTVEQIIA